MKKELSMKNTPLNYEIPLRSMRRRRRYVRPTTWQKWLPVYDHV
jgi:hypothetical protein